MTNRQLRYTGPFPSPSSSQVARSDIVQPTKIAIKNVLISTRLLTTKKSIIRNIVASLNTLIKLSGVKSDQILCENTEPKPITQATPGKHMGVNINDNTHNDFPPSFLLAISASAAINPKELQLVPCTMLSSIASDSATWSL